MYTVASDAVTADLAALPDELLADFAELRAALEVSPWTVGLPLVPQNPNGLRMIHFGAAGRAQLVFGVIERDRPVTLLQCSAC